MTRHFNLFQTPLSAMKPITKDALGLMLDTRKILPTDKGTLRDWRGLAELVGLSAVQQSALNNKQDCRHTELVLKQWQELNDPKVPPNLGSLQELLKDLDRWDIFDDVTPLFESDAEKYSVFNDASPVDSKVVSDTEAITVDDIDRISRGLPIQQYDAMLLYADEDIRKAKQILDNLEDRNLKVFEKTRDLIPGVFEFEAVMEMIANRCNRIIVIFSDHLFQNDSLNSFLVSYAQSVGIETNKRKVIPVTFEMCKIPRTLNFNFRLDYTKTGVFWNFYDKLYDSVRPEHFPSSKQLAERKNPTTLPSVPREDFSNSSISLDSAYLSRAPTAAEKSKSDLEPFPSPPTQVQAKKSLLSHIPGTSSLRKLIKKKKKVASPLLA